LYREGIIGSGSKSLAINERRYCLRGKLGFSLRDI
jgi:hypothetical protein